MANFIDNLMDDLGVLGRPSDDGLADLLNEFDGGMQAGGEHAAPELNPPKKGLRGLRGLQGLRGLSHLPTWQLHGECVGTHSNQQFDVI